MNYDRVKSLRNNISLKKQKCDNPLYIELDTQERLSHEHFSTSIDTYK